MNKQEAIDRFDRFLNLKGSAGRTKNCYRNWLERFLDFHESAPISELTIFDAQDYLIALKEEGRYAERSYNQAVYAIRNFYNGVLNQRADNTNLPGVYPPRTDKQFFTAAQARQLIHECTDPRLKAAMALSFGSGLRIDEICRIQIKHIHSDGQRGMITVVNSKFNRTRSVHYSTLAAAALREYCQVFHITRHDPEAFLFQDAKKPGQRLPNSSIREPFMKYIQDFPFTLEGHTFHSLRHSFATALAMRDFPLPLIQKEMGHASCATTAGYIHVPAEDTREFPDLLAGEDDS